MKSIKNLGSAVFMALSLLAIFGVASASANWFKAEVEPERWNGAITGKHHSMFLGSTGTPFYCTGVSFTGETTVKTTGEVTVSPEIGNCEHIGSGKTSWKINGCKFRFHAGSSALPGTVDIVGCASPMSWEESKCRSEIGNQSGLGNVEYKNTTVEGVPAIIASAKLSGITYKHTFGACGEVAPEGTFHDGTYQGEWLIKGATISGGILTGVQFEVAESPHRFIAREAPATIARTATTTMTVWMSSMAGNGLRCESFALNGTMASTSAGTVSLVPTYKKCTVGEEAVPDSWISAGGCSYVLHADGTFDIAGATCASNPISVKREGCVVTLGPQSGLSGKTYKNEGGVVVSGVAVVTYTATGTSCSKTGTFTNGWLVSNGTLTATNSLGETQPFLFE